MHDDNNAPLFYFVLTCVLLVNYRYQQVPMDGPYRGEHREGGTY